MLSFAEHLQSAEDADSRKHVLISVVFARDLAVTVEPCVAVNMKALSRTRNTSVGNRNSSDLSHALETKLN